MLLDELKQELQRLVRNCDTGKQSEVQVIDAVSRLVDELATRHSSRIEAGKYVIALLRDLPYPCCKTIADAILRQVERHELLG